MSFSVIIPGRVTCGVSACTRLYYCAKLNKACWKTITYRWLIISKYFFCYEMLPSKFKTQFGDHLASSLSFSYNDETNIIPSPKTLSRAGRREASRGPCHRPELFWKRLSFRSQPHRQVLPCFFLYHSLMLSFAPFRLLARHPCSIFSIFHELSSNLLYNIVWSILPPWRSGWPRCQGPWPNFQVWGCSRHGHRPVCLAFISHRFGQLITRKMHYILFIVLSLLRLSLICHSLPISYRFRFQQPLYAYVQVRCSIIRPHRI